jgi:hypothetical protein
VFRFRAKPETETLLPPFASEASKSGFYFGNYPTLQPV